MKFEIKLPKDFLGVKKFERNLKTNFKKFSSSFYKKLHSKTKYTKGYSTGATKKSLSYQLETTKGKCKMLIGYKTHYAPYLEYGTKKMKAQSHLLSSVKQKNLKDELKKVIINSKG